ncbi:hypothetical protein K438DRAFT_1817960 [Mycena galopus ATCC 62051]|nr:hypothetical protein K438DRAFT_1817960 [Mycena galopus ATCC 62051]
MPLKTYQQQLLLPWSVLPVSRLAESVLYTRNFVFASFCARLRVHALHQESGAAGSRPELGPMIPVPFDSASLINQRCPPRAVMHLVQRLLVRPIHRTTWSPRLPRRQSPTPTTQCQHGLRVFPLDSLPAQPANARRCHTSENRGSIRRDQIPATKGTYAILHLDENDIIINGDGQY